MRVASLFSGIAGLDHGLARAGFEHVFLCEADEWRRGVLRARFPGVPVYDDVRRVAVGEPAGRAANGSVAPDHDGRREAWSGLPGGVDLLAGGFPCQDVSVAGRRKGLAGERSGLFHEFARIIDALRPRWVLVENVPGLLSSNGGRDFGVVVGTLADLGYGVAWRVLDSRFFGVPQRRRRVFVVGTLALGDPRAAAERAGEVLAVGSRCPRHPATRGEAGADVAVASLSGLGSGGPDDNDGQGGRLVAGAYSSVTGRKYDSLPTLDKGSGDGPRRNQDAPIIAAPLSHGSNPNSNMSGRRREDDDHLVAYSLRRSPGGTGQGHNTTYVTAFHQTQEPIHGDDFSPALGRTSIGMGVSEGASVRRLTPTECERLQALPDGWTNPDGTAPDSRRYAALGDAVTASVAEWIGRRILASGQPLEEPV